MQLVLRHLNKAFRKPVLRDISYTFEAGKLYLIKGISGCGKTTLLNVLGGIDTEYEGEILRDVAVTCGYIFQKSLLMAGLTARENLLLIRNDPRRTEQLAEELGIGSLLDKLPSELSGGERQRISVARALLNDPQLILADEPTASLDGENSARIAELLEELRRPDRIIIVATHENCFDQMADVILRLDYGVMREEKTCPARACTCGETSGHMEGEERRKPLVRCSLKRHPELLKLKSLLPLALAFLMLFLAGTLQQSYKREALRFFVKRYPMDLASFTKQQYDDFEHKEWVTLYDYLEARENGVTAYYLMPEKDSVLHVEGMLAYGTFPQKKDGVILTREAAEILFPGTSYADCVGQSFLFCGRDWTVSAVTAVRDRDFNTAFRADQYYAYAARAAVFIAYDVLREFAEVKDPPVYSDSRMAVVEGLALDPEKQSAVKEALTVKVDMPPGLEEEGETIEGNANVFFSLISASQEQIDVIVRYFYLIFGLICFLICLYMISVIRTELFYRRRELGYLQIFGLSLREVQRMLLGEHAVRLLAAMVLAVGFGIVLIALYYAFFGGSVYPSPFTFVLCAGVIGLYLLFAWFTIRCFLQKSIRELITE